MCGSESRSPWRQEEAEGVEDQAAVGAVEAAEADHRRASFQAVAVEEAEAAAVGAAEVEVVEGRHQPGET